jgi:hypothetical protein
MPNRDWHDDEEDWSETDGDESEEAFDDDADSDSIPCPACGRDLYADLDHCPSCGHWLTDADREPRGTGLFATHRVRLIALALLVIFILTLLTELFLLGGDG